MLREEAHNLVDWLFDHENQTSDPEVHADDGGELSIPPLEAEIVEKPKPEGQRVVRTNTSGDRVYLLDDNKKTRAWITKPEVLDGLGFSAADVEEVTDDEMFKYQMGPALYEVPSENG